MEKDKIYKILGSGPSGLSAAITLARAGKRVEVYEQRAVPGGRFNGDLQGLENWSKDEDALDFIKRIGIEINFDHSACTEAELTSGKETSKLAFSRPLCYMVKRGSFEGAFDYGLAKQASEAGVKINYNSSIDKSEADIIAIGPDPKNAFALAKGIVFKTNHKDVSVCLLNNEAAKYGYSYLLVTKGYGVIATCLPTRFADRINGCFEATKEILGQKYHVAMSEPHGFGGYGAVAVEAKFMEADSLLVGEAAGIQDMLAGFGIRTALFSGNLAANCLINNEDYDKKACACFDDYLKAGIVNRYIFEKLKALNFDGLVCRYIDGDKLIRRLRLHYGFDAKQKLLYPLARRYIKGEHLKYAKSQEEKSSGN